MGVFKDLYLTGTSGTLATLVNGPSWHDDVPATGNMHNGFVARFRDGDNAPLWVTYLGKGTNHEPYCLDISGSGSPVLTIGGHTNDPNFQAVQWPGHYYQDTYVDDFSAQHKDGFIMHFNQNQDLVWSTLFGGEGGTLISPENVTALCNHGNSIYTVGYTSKPMNNPASPFPLAGNTDNGTFFNPLFNYNGLTSGWTDCFITEFCNELPIGIEEEPPAGHPSPIAWHNDGRITLIGLTNGPHGLRVYDSQGKLVAQQDVQSNGGRSDAVRLPKLSETLYIVVVDNKQTVKVVPAP